MTVKVMFHVQSVLGGGHTKRIQALARGCEAAGMTVLVATGEKQGALGPTIPHCALDIVRTRDAQFKRYVTDGGAPADDAVWSRRRTQLLQAFNELKPDVLVIEGYPFARSRFVNELTPLIAASKDAGTALLCSIRDILQPIPKPERRERSLAWANADFDAILVHGEESLTPLSMSFPLADAIAPPLIYTGYVDNPDWVEPARDEDRSGAGEIVVSAGAGAIGATIYRAAVASADRSPGWRWRVLLGADLDPQIAEELRQSASENCIVEAARSDFRTVLTTAQASVSLCGYNTAVDLMAVAPPALVIPFEGGGEREQLMRAECFEPLGLWRVLRECDLTPDKLIAALKQILAADAPARSTIPRDGIARSVAAIARIASEERRR
ncbi:MAG: glycosyltransferase [Alphaproteobacteria bacterium]|nr:glycosyltransferase [Alphaproteobacteria bacterium]